MLPNRVEETATFTSKKVEIKNEIRFSDKITNSSLLTCTKMLKCD